VEEKPVLDAKECPTSITTSNITSVGNGSNIKITFTKLGAGSVLGWFAAFQFRIFCIPVPSKNLSISMYKTLSLFITCL